MHDKIILVYNHCIKISKDFRKIVLCIVHKWIYPTHSYMSRMSSPTLLKLSKIVMECLWTQNMLLCQFEEFSDQI